jgi:CMP/dCMP kinase
VKPVVVAIDGPSASGKSTVARRVAVELQWLYVDSGALYRAVAWLVLDAGISCTDREGVVGALGTIAMEFLVEQGAVRFRLNGRELRDELRGQAVTENVSPVAAVPEVRSLVGDWLRSMTRFGSLVMEGRDIGTAVFPATPYKFYLDASPEERARRRFLQKGDGGAAASVGEVVNSLKRRDTIDSRRKADPLKIAADARVIDSTAMPIDDVVRLIVDRVRGGEKVVVP